MVGLVLIPLGQPWGGLEGVTCKGTLDLWLCRCRYLLHLLSSSPFEVGSTGTGFSDERSLTCHKSYPVKNCPGHSS